MGPYWRHLHPPWSLQCIAPASTWHGVWVPNVRISGNCNVRRTTRPMLEACPGCTNLSGRVPTFGMWRRRIQPLRCHAVCRNCFGEPLFSLNLPIRLFISCDWLDSSSLAAALSSAVAEFVCTTLEIWPIPTVS